MLTGRLSPRQHCANRPQREATRAILRRSDDLFCGDKVRTTEALKDDDRDYDFINGL
ncbi:MULTISPECIES: hypothetical protein [unclassified Nostoc]|uniref:hypothetical protein n=1 Tax=unclassified Nostoc TaxID=2593658 RepID=UPI00132EBBB6|nr:MULTISPECIES: hypothetical protein [unclassified Nostoc]MBD2509219.1 hypothetical protein [Desmonostoc muscorum FACHB-395]QHG14537.1 hypothetical protein GJB62_00010 [Nostoc sp. ATCC 53789]